MEKIKSPKTGYMITVNGRAYNKLLEDGYSREQLLAKPEKVKSPKTGKLISINGQTYKKLQKEGYFSKNMVELPEEAILNLILNTNPYDLISLYNTNKVYNKLLNDLHTIELLYNKYNLYKYKMSFNNFILEYLQEDMRNQYFSRNHYLETDLYIALNKIQDVWNNYQLKITNAIKGSSFDMAIIYLKKHGFQDIIDQVDPKNYRQWLQKLTDKVTYFILSKRGNYTTVPKKDLLPKGFSI